MKTDHPYRLLAPGPVPVPEAVLEAMGARILHHRTPQFMQKLNQVWARLRDVFQTRQPVLILTATGSAAMEAAVVNTLSPGDEALVVVSGKFGERWAEICERYGVTTHRWNLPWGEAASTSAFEEKLRAHPRLRAVFTQVCETSTATLHPVREMARLTHQLAPDAVFAIDAITGVGCLPLPMDEWGFDVVVAGSQKAFMIPTGLSFIALSERAWKAQARSQIKKFYLDLAGEKKANDKGDSQFSIPTPLILGLNVVLERLHTKGLEHLWQRTATLAEATRECGAKLGLATYSKAPAPSVTALITPSDSGKIRDWLESERGITIMGGQDQLKGKVLRVGHMGDVRDDDMLALFAALCENLQKDFASVKAELSTRLKKAEPLFP